MSVMCINKYSSSCPTKTFYNRIINYFKTTMDKVIKLSHTFIVLCIASIFLLLLLFIMEFITRTNYLKTLIIPGRCKESYLHQQKKNQQYLTPAEKIE